MKEIDFLVANRSAKSTSSTLHILGAGSIGLLFASSIRRKFPNKDVRLLLQPHHQRRLIPMSHKKNKKEPILKTEDFNVNDTNKYLSCVLFSSKDSNNNHYDAISIPIRAEIIPDSTKNGTKLNPGNFTCDLKIENLLLCTKAQDSLAAVSSISNRLAKNAKVIILSNGALAIKDQLKQQFPFLYSSNASTTSNSVPSLLLASTTHGAYRIYDTYSIGNTNSSFLNNSLTKENCNETSRLSSTFHYQVKHAGVGDTFVQEDENISQLFHLSGLSHHSHSFDESKICILLWKKLAANCVINPLTALYRINNGELLSDIAVQSKILDQEPSEADNFSDLIQQITEEVSQIALAHFNANINTRSISVHAKKGHSKSNNDISRNDNIENFEKNDEDLKQLQCNHLVTFVYDVIQKTSQNQSSMLQDVLSCRKTEIDYLNGYICQLGEVYGIPTPHNTRLCVAIKNLVQSYSA